MSPVVEGDSHQMRRAIVDACAHDAVNAILCLCADTQDAAFLEARRVHQLGKRVRHVLGIVAGITGVFECLLDVGCLAERNQFFGKAFANCFIIAALRDADILLRNLHAERRA